MPRLVQDEPGALDGMAGIQGTAIVMIDQFSFGSANFEHCLVLFVQMIAADLVDTPIDPLVCLAAAKSLAQDLSGVQQDHRHAEAAARPRLGIDLGRQLARGGQQPGGGMEKLLGAPPHGRISRGMGVRRQSHHGEHFRVDVPALPQRPPLARHLEEHPSVPIETVLQQEFDAAARRLQPQVAWFDSRVQHRQQPSETALNPNRLVRIDHFASPIQRREVTSVLSIRSVPQPEGQRIFEQAIAVNGDQAAHLLRFDR